MLDGEMERRRLFNDDMLQGEKGELGYTAPNFHEDPFDQGGGNYHPENSDAGVTYDVTLTEMKKEKDTITGNET